MPFTVNQDWVALLFTTFTIALQIAGELKDIMLCQFAIYKAGDGLSKPWRLAFKLLNGMRRYLFLPILGECTTCPSHNFVDTGVTGRLSCEPRS